MLTFVLAIMELYYTTQILDDKAFLPEEESYHCIKILRNQVSDKIHFTNGAGIIYEGRITMADSKKCEVSIIKEEKQKNRDYYLHIAIAPTKSADRIEFFIEKAIEIGVDEISFIKCERSERKEVKVERLKKIALSAMKQSKKAFLPVLNEMISYKEFIKNNSSKVCKKYIACLVEGVTVLLKEVPSGQNDYLFLIGPEGDFSPNEIKMAVENKFVPLSLGGNIYRTETAGMVISMYLYNLHL